MPRRQQYFHLGINKKKNKLHIQLKVLLNDKLRHKLHKLMIV